MNVNSISDEDLQDWFSEAFEEQVGSFEIEASCEREAGQTEIRMDVTVSGMAGDPTVDDFKNGSVAHADRITVEREGRGELTFRLLADQVSNLNSSEFILVYQSV